MCLLCPHSPLSSILLFLLTTFFIISSSFFFFLSFSFSFSSSFLFSIIFSFAFFVIYHIFFLLYPLPHPYSFFLFVCTFVFIFMLIFIFVLSSMLPVAPTILPNNSFSHRAQRESKIRESSVEVLTLTNQKLQAELKETEEAFQLVTSEVPH